MAEWRGALFACAGLCGLLATSQVQAWPMTGGSSAAVPVGMGGPPAAPIMPLASAPQATWVTWTAAGPDGEGALRLSEAEAVLFGRPKPEAPLLRQPLAGQGAALPATTVLPRSAADGLAERRGLDPDDIRVQFDLRPAAVTFWIGSAAEDGILRDIAVSPWNAKWGADIFSGVSYSHRLGRFWRDFAADVEAGGGFRAGRTDTPEAWGALYVRYDGFPWRNRLYTSFGLSAGLNWVNRLPESETGPPDRREPHTSRVLHYFSPEFVFALPAHPEHEIAIRYAHRSGMFGLFNGVWEGSNVLMLGYRRRL